MERPNVTAAAAAALVLCLLAAPLPGAAQSGKGEYLGAWSVSASGGYATPDNDRYEGAPAWRLALGYSPLPRVGLELEYGRFPAAVATDAPGGIPAGDLAAGTLDVRAFCLTAQWRQPLGGLPATLVALGGVGRYRISYAMGDEPRRLYAESGVRGLPDQTVDDAWGAHVGGGLEWAVGAHVSLLAEARYLVLAPGVSGHTTPGNALDGSIDLGTLVVTGGIKATF